MFTTLSLRNLIHTLWFYLQRSAQCFRFSLMSDLSDFLFLSLFFSFRWNLWDNGLGSLIVLFYAATCFFWLLHVCVFFLFPLSSLPTSSLLLLGRHAYRGVLIYPPLIVNHLLLSIQAFLTVLHFGNFFDMIPKSSRHRSLAIIYTPPTGAEKSRCLLSNQASKQASLHSRLYEFFPACCRLPRYTPAAPSSSFPS